MAGRYKVHWRRADRCYVVVGEGGREVARVDTLDEAYAVEQALHREERERIEARRKQAQAARQALELMQARKARAGRAAIA